MARILLSSLGLVAATAAAAISTRQARGSVDDCPGYTASNVATTGTGLTADLSLAGAACNAYGRDIENLRLLVNYDTGNVHGAGDTAYVSH